MIEIIIFPAILFIAGLTVFFSSWEKDVFHCEYMFIGFIFVALSALYFNANIQNLINKDMEKRIVVLEQRLEKLESPVKEIVDKDMKDLTTE